MKYAYDYFAKSKSGSIISGIAYGDDQDSIWFKLKSTGLAPKEVKFNLGATINGLMSSDMNPKELARFYRTLSKRMENGRSIGEGLNAAIEFISDDKLKQSVMLMRVYIDEMELWEAMKNAGFPTRDTSMLKATRNSGRSAETLMILSESISRQAAMKSAMGKVLSMPIAITGFMYFALFGLTVFVAPKMAKAIEQIPHAHISNFTKGYYAIAQAAFDNLIIASALWLTMGILLIMFFRSEFFKKLLDKSYTIRQISQRGDMANLWSSFAIMYDAGENSEDACRLLIDAAARQDSKLGFKSMSKNIQAGLTILDAVKRSPFPKFVTTGVAAAESSGNLVSGLFDMTTSLYQDVEDYSEKLSTIVKLVMPMILAFMIMGFFFLTYYPMMSTIMSNL